LAFSTRVGLPVEHNRGPIGASTRNDADDTFIVGTRAGGKRTTAVKHHYGTGVHGCGLNHIEFLGAVGVGQRNVTGNKYVALEEAGKTTAGVDGSQRGRTALSRGIDADRTSAGAGNAGPSFTVTPNTGVSIAMAGPKNPDAIACVDGPQRGRTALSRGIDADRTGAGAGNAGPSFTVTPNTGVSIAMAGPKNPDAIACVDGPQRGRTGLSLGVDTDRTGAGASDAGPSLTVAPNTRAATPGLSRLDGSNVRITRTSIYRDTHDLFL
jgi:hypothetical protein